MIEFGIALIGISTVYITIVSLADIYHRTLDAVAAIAGAVGCLVFIAGMLLA